MNYKISKQKQTSYWIDKHIQGIYVSAMTNVVHNKIGIKLTLAYVYSKNHTKLQKTLIGGDRGDRGDLERWHAGERI